ncbi:MAG TPA: divalent-cation tolerance protein CutA, partial [Candidatus Berkiella sp.]|nr:divalent-cation tolerance protein CutA [Candidatus Berkiella sp.]
METAYYLILCTCPNQATALQIAQELLGAGLVACTNIIPNLTSIYSWEGKLMQNEESLLYLKTRKDKLTDLEQAILTIHPYKVPEFIVTPITYCNG